MVNPLQIIELAAEDWCANSPDDVLNEQVFISLELSRACAADPSIKMKLSPDCLPDYELLIDGWACLIDPKLNGLVAYTRYRSIT